MKISVILPAYNEEKYIKNAIESVLNQSFNDFELIIVNDGSSDNTRKIIENIDDTRIKIINQTNQGPGASRNNAMKIAQGDYIMFLDGDDEYCPDALQIAYDEITSNNTDISIFQIIKYNGDSYSENNWFNLDNFPEEFENRVFDPHECRKFLFDISVSACQRIFKTSFLKEIDAKFPEGIFFEDMPFSFTLILKLKGYLLSKSIYTSEKSMKVQLQNLLTANF